LQRKDPEQPTLQSAIEGATTLKSGKERRFGGNTCAPLERSATRQSAPAAGRSVSDEAGGSRPRERRSSQL
jgi:hypothetical protein